jgi:DNA polymerase alpha subunit B
MTMQSIFHYIVRRTLYCPPRPSPSPILLMLVDFYMQGSQTADVQLLGPKLPMPFRMLHNPQASAAASLETRITAFEAALAATHGWVIDPVNTGSASDVHVVGRVSTDALGKARPCESSLLLEGSRATSHGTRVKLDVSLLTDFSLFPGQVIGVRGRNPTGCCVTAHEIVDAVPLALSPQATLPDAAGERSDLRMVAAAGPFVAADTLTFEPLRALLQYCKEHTPGLLLLCGPFVPDNHPALLQLQLTFQQLFEQEVVSPLQDFQHEHPEMRILIQPAVSDAHHLPVHPQPPFPAAAGLDMLPSPAHVSVAGITVSSSASGIVMDLSSTEVSRTVCARYLLTASTARTRCP